MKKTRLRRVLKRRANRAMRREIEEAWALLLAGMSRIQPQPDSVAQSPVTQMLYFLERLNQLLTHYEALLAMLQDESLIRRLAAYQQATQTLWTALVDRGLVSAELAGTEAGVSSLMGVFDPLSEIIRRTPVSPHTVN